MRGLKMNLANLSVQQISTSSVSGRLSQMQDGQHRKVDDNTRLCRVLGEFDMFVDERERSLGKCLLDYGHWEAWITRAIARHLRPGMTAIDVGAHFGYFACLMSKIVGERGLVVAIEPHDHLRELCRMSLSHNGFCPSIISENALWDESGLELELSTPGWLLGSSSLIGHGPPVDGEEVKKQKVTTCTLDEMLARSNVSMPIDFVKIDCEGAELQIWRGMCRTWQQSMNLVVCAEYLPTPHGREFLAELRREGVYVRVVDHSGNLASLKESDLEDIRMFWITR